MTENSRNEKNLDSKPCLEDTKDMETEARMKIHRSVTTQVPTEERIHGTKEKIS